MTEGRRFGHAARVGLADAAPDGRARPDALARHLQDAAFADVTDAGVAQDGAWIVRRTRMEIERYPRLGDALELTTWCSGLGRMWAQRRTTINAGAVEATALWVYVDPQTGRPRPLEPEQLAVWEPSAAGQRVRARLQHPPPPDGLSSEPFAFRFSDLDAAGHVNNAAYWTVLADVPDAPCTAEIEFRGGAPAGPAEVRRDGELTWICAPSGELFASIALTRTMGG